MDQVYWLTQKGRHPPPGEVWSRISYYVNATNTYVAEALLGQKGHHYPWVRLFDGEMNIREDPYEHMVKPFSHRNIKHAIRYTDECSDSAERRVLNGHMDSGLTTP